MACTELSVGTRGLFVPLVVGSCLGFAVVPIGTIATILREFHQPTVTIGPIAVGILFYVIICLSLSAVFALVIGTWFVLLVRTISQAKAADGSELVLLALALGWLSLATVMECLTHWVGWPSVSELTDPFQLRRDVWLVALPLFGILTIWIFARRAWRAAWLARVRRGRVRDHVLEPIGLFPNADEIPPFHSTGAPYTSVLVRRTAETSTVLRRTSVHSNHKVRKAVSVITLHVHSRTRPTYAMSWQ